MSDQEKIDWNNYLSVPEAASLLRVSKRVIYTYLVCGRLEGIRVGYHWGISRKSLSGFQPKSPGPKRCKQRAWRKPALSSFLVTVEIPLQPGAEPALPAALSTMKGSHALPLVFQFLSHDDEAFYITLVRRSDEEPEAILTAIQDMLQEYLDLFIWDDLAYQERPVDLVANL